MPIALTTPIALTFPVSGVANYVAVFNISVAYTNDASNPGVTLVWGTCDALGNNTPGPLNSVTLGAYDLVLFATYPGIRGW